MSEDCRTVARRGLRIASTLVILLFVTGTWLVALYYAFSCGGDDHENAGRELREIPNARRLIFTPEPVCALMQTATLTKNQDEFVDPWGEKAWIKALDVGNQIQEEVQAEMMKLLDLGCVHDGLFPYAPIHKKERLWTLEHPEEPNVMPWKHSSAQLQAFCFEYALPHADDLNQKCQEVRAMMKNWPEWSNIPKYLGENLAIDEAVHFADLENAVRRFQGLPTMPDTKEFIVKHWIPLLWKYKKMAYERHGRRVEGAAIHSSLMVDQVEKIRTHR